MTASRMASIVATTASILVALLATPSDAGEEGKRARNGEQPRHGTLRLELQELWRAGGDHEDYLFGVIRQLTHDRAGNLYLLDGQLTQIYVFSPDGEYLRTIGREGEGPGEFRDSYDFYLGPNERLGVVQVFPGRIVQLATDGSPAGTFPLPSIQGGGFQLVYRGRASRDRVVLAGAHQLSKGGSQRVQVKYLKSFDLDGNEMTHFHSESHPTRYGGMRFDEKTFTGFQKRWAVSSDNHVAAAKDFDAYRIHVWNADGSLKHVIERPDYKPVVRTAAAKERFQLMYDGLTSWNPGSSFQVSDTHETISQLVFRDDGSLWVLASDGIYGNPEGVFASFDIYDSQGAYDRRVELVAGGDPAEDAVFFVGNRIYVVTDFFSAYLSSLGGEDSHVVEEPEPISIIAYSLDMSRVAVNQGN